jgi:hypothetical protein
VKILTTKPIMPQENNGRPLLDEHKLFSTTDLEMPYMSLAVVSAVETALNRTVNPAVFPQPHPYMVRAL